MVNGLESFLAEALAATMEEMAFLEVAPGEPEQGVDEDADFVWAKIAFHQPVKGNMMLALPRGLLAEVASGIFVGLDPEETEARMFDVISELANIVAGRLARRSVGENRSFEVGLPSTGEGPLGSLSGAGRRYVFNAEEKPILLFLEGDGIT